MTTPPDTLDPVERALVADGAAVLHRDKHVARTAALAMLPGIVVFALAGVAVLAGADPAAPRALALLPFGLVAAFVYTLLANLVVRSLVTADAVRVQWGMRRITVPLAAITRVEVSAAADPRWRLFASQGAALLAWREGDRERTVLLPAQSPEALVAAVEAARAHITGVRVEEARDEAQAPASEARTGSTRAAR